MLADQHLQQLSGPVPGRGRAGDLAIGLMETAQLVVRLRQKLSVAGPARLLANQPVQVVERLLQDLGRFGRLSTVKVETAQIEVRDTRDRSGCGPGPETNGVNGRSVRGRAASGASRARAFWIARARR